MLYRPLVLLLLCLTCLGFQAAPPPVTVAIKELDPFVRITPDGYSGFSIDWWQRIADHAGLAFEYVEVATVGDQLDAVQNGAAELAIAGISITSEREELLDFSHPYFDAGLRIMIRADRGLLPLADLLAALFSPALLELVAIMLLFILLVAHVFWLFERRRNPDFPHAYLPGIGEAIWWSAVTVTTVGYGDRTPRGPIGRALAIVWMFMGLLLIANFTAGATSIITLQQLQGRIAGVSDLSGKRVVTVTGSTAADFLGRQRIPARRVQIIDEAYTLLEEGRVDAVVYDAPVLNYYANNAGQGRVRVVGSLLEIERYGIALPNDSSLREIINRSMLELTEDGTYAQLLVEWFGPPPA